MTAGALAFQARLNWSAGSDAACLTLVQLVEGTPVTVAIGSIPAGASERYGEQYAPELLGDALWFEGEAPWIVTRRTQQSASGGGGEWISVWRPAGGVWTEALTVARDTYTDINALTETPCAPHDLFLRQRAEVVEAQTCFDGRLQPIDRWHIAGGQAEPLPAEVESAPFGEGTAALLADGALWVLQPGSAQRVPPITEASDQPGWAELPHAVHVEDLDGAGGPEVVVVTNTAGPTCCALLSVVYADATTGAYTRTIPLSRRRVSGFAITDLDGDDRSEFRTLNDAFVIALSGPNASTETGPLQILRYAAGDFIDVTDAFPTVLTERVTRWALEVIPPCKLDRAGRYLAEMTLSGRGAEARAAIAACAFKPGDRARLDAAMLASGYVAP